MHPSLYTVCQWRLQPLVALCIPHNFFSAGSPAVCDEGGMEDRCYSSTESNHLTALSNSNTWTWVVFLQRQTLCRILLSAEHSDLQAENEWALAPTMTRSDTEAGTCCQDEKSWRMLTVLQTLLPLSLTKQHHGQESRQRQEITGKVTVHLCGSVLLLQQ